MTSPHSDTTVANEDSDEEGGGISSERFKFPVEYNWMDGRSVFIRPEGRPSNAAQRDIINSREERDALSRAHIEATLARRALSSADLKSEILEFREFEKETPTE